MRTKRIAAAVLATFALSVIGPTPPASAHTTHAHTCVTPSHNLVQDSFSWKHNNVNATVDWKRISTQYHYYWVASGDTGHWQYSHSKSQVCLIV